jgi:hypothetical protein
MYSELLILHYVHVVDISLLDGYLNGSECVKVGDGVAAFQDIKVRREEQDSFTCPFETIIASISEEEGTEHVQQEHPFRGTKYLTYRQYQRSM